MQLAEGQGKGIAGGVSAWLDEEIVGETLIAGGFTVHGRQPRLTGVRLQFRHLLAAVDACDRVIGSHTLLRAR